MIDDLKKIIDEIMKQKNARLRCLALLSNKLSSNHGKRMQKPDCRKTFAFGIPKEIIHKNDEIDKQKI